MRGEWISRDVWEDPAVAFTARLLGSGAALNIVEGAAAATACQLVLTALVGALAYEAERMLGEELTGREGLDCEALKRQTDLLTDFATELRNLEVSPELCMTPVPGWKWEPECQTVTDRPFEPSGIFGGHLVITLRAIEPVVSLDGSTTVTADADDTVSYAAHAVGGASDEYTWRITPEPTFLFTGEGQAS